MGKRARAALNEYRWAIDLGLLGYDLFSLLDPNEERFDPLKLAEESTMLLLASRSRRSRRFKRLIRMNSSCDRSGRTRIAFETETQARRACVTTSSAEQTIRAKFTSQQSAQGSVTRRHSPSRSACGRSRTRCAPSIAPARRHRGISRMTLAEEANDVFSEKSRDGGVGAERLLRAGLVQNFHLDAVLLSVNLNYVVVTQ